MSSYIDKLNEQYNNGDISRSEKQKLFDEYGENGTEDQSVLNRSVLNKCRIRKTTQNESSEERLIKRTFFPVTIFLILIACGLYYLTPDNSPFDIEKELPHPEIIKGMKLGLNPKEQIKIAESNDICKSQYEYRLGWCCYEIAPSIFARPQYKNMVYKGEKVLSKVILNLFDFKTMEYTNFLGKEVLYMGMKKPQIDELINTYSYKYGKGEVFDSEHYGGVDWHYNGMLIRIIYTEPSYAIVGRSKNGDKFTRPKDEYAVDVIYTYDSENNSLLDFPKQEDNRFGEQGNQNI